VEKDKSVLLISLPHEHKNPEPSEIGDPRFTKISPSQIQVSSEERNLRLARTNIQATTIISHICFLIPQV